ncbi:MAG TPA: EamA family transporter RarD [Xanthomonadales bacterium]|nr:EamA family transporter RarD [Xanthomonadales bacterium]
MSAGGNHSRLGVSAALAAFVAWGVAPIYFKFLAAAPPSEIIAHRVLWSLPVLSGFLLFRDGLQFINRMRLSLRQILGLLLSGSVLACNWLLFVWAVNNDQILSTSLGYFINPLVNVLLGYVFLRERLLPLEIGAVFVAALGTAYLTWYLGVAPWISLGLAFSFGAYGLIRKKLDVGPMTGLLWESILLSLPSVFYLLWVSQQGSSAFGQGDTQLDVLLALAGFVTVLPLIWFNTAARYMTLSTLGFFQYIAPSLTFTLAVFIYGETFTQGHAVAFTCIWAALLVISVDRLLRARRQRQQLQ